MGLFKKKTRRSTRRAQEKALKHKAKLEAKFSARNERKHLRAERRATGKVAKAQVSALKAQERAAAKAAEKATRSRFGAGQVKQYVGVARVLAPVLLPLAYRGATLVRAQLDTRRAQHLGVELERLADFSGHGAKLSARIANAETSTGEILDRRPTNPDVKAFAAATRERLGDLSTAVRAAEHMPATQRKAAHITIDTDLATLEADILSQLGLD